MSFSLSARGQHTVEFAVLMGLVISAIIAMQFYVRSRIQAAEYNLTSSVLGQPVIQPAGYTLPRTGCLDNSGDGLCDCMDSDRDGACDGMNSQSNSRADEAGGPGGRNTTITETNAGSSFSSSMSYQPIYTGYTQPRIAVPRTMATPSYVPPSDGPDIQMP